jgi:hypothetical protein
MNPLMAYPIHSNIDEFGGGEGTKGTTWTCRYACVVSNELQKLDESHVSCYRIGSSQRITTYPRKQVS